MQHLTKLGIKNDIVEFPANPFSGKRKDLFHIIDIIALYPEGICGIQACGADRKAHDIKIRESMASLYWIDCGGILELWSWRKLKVKRGGKAVRWTPKIYRYTAEDMQVK